jgi:hypothetical protein
MQLATLKLMTHAADEMEDMEVNARAGHYI